MAEESKTEYRLLKKVNGDPTKTLEDLGVPADAPLFVLLPDTHTGNVRKAAHETYGPGDYAKVAARSFDEFPVRVEEVVRYS